MITAVPYPCRPFSIHVDICPVIYLTFFFPPPNFACKPSGTGYVLIFPVLKLQAAIHLKLTVSVINYTPI